VVVMDSKPDSVSTNSIGSDVSTGDALFGWTAP
jgi:PTS system glucose-specific IIA component/PTS system N-acetylglucosamine-specific IIA component